MPYSYISRFKLVLFLIFILRVGIERFVTTTSTNPNGQNQPATLHSSFGPQLRNLDLVGPPKMRVASRVIMLQDVIILVETLTTDFKKM